MKNWLIFFIIIWMSACQSTQPPPQEQSLPQASALPITRIEAKNAACESGDGSNPELCSCIASELYRIGQEDVFKTNLLNGAKCKAYEKARQHSIRFFVDDAERICRKEPPPLYSMACWDGSPFEWNDPCFKCPLPPF